jgi:hypothetical protein
VDLGVVPKYVMILPPVFPFMSNTLELLSEDWNLEPRKNFTFPEFTTQFLSAVEGDCKMLDVNDSKSMVKTSKLPLSIMLSRMT